MVLLEFSISPFDKGESLGKYVARVINVIDRSGISYRLNPMGTVLEGEYEEVMRVVESCFRELEKDCHRISISIKMDYRKGKNSRLNSKIEKIESILGRKVKT